MVLLSVCSEMRNLYAGVLNAIRKGLRFPLPLLPLHLLHPLLLHPLPSLPFLFPSPSQIPLCPRCDCKVRAESGGILGWGGMGAVSERRDRERSNSAAERCPSSSEVTPAGLDSQWQDRSWGPLPML